MKPVLYDKKKKGLSFSSGTVEGLKFLALLLMTGDHINKYLFNGTLPFLYEAGRVAMPLFVAILSYNLARPETLKTGVYRRTMIRLAVFGSLATAPFIALGGVESGWWPLNIMFTLFLLAAMLRLIERDDSFGIAAAIILFIGGGAIVEYWWPALLFGVSVWFYCRNPSPNAGIAIFFACALLTYINGNFWALLAIPVLSGAAYVQLHIPRFRWIFYAYYPLHLLVLLLIRIPMADAGYLFFT